MTPNRVKAKRITQACDFCHRRGLKCRAASPNLTPQPGASCLTCQEYGQECTRNRQPKKRGTKPKADTPGINLSERASSRGSVDRALNDVRGLSSIGGGMPSTNLTNRKVITALLDIYLDTIHPMYEQKLVLFSRLTFCRFPLFCEREIWVGWRDGSFPRDASEYMSLMCMCALSAQHAGNGALFTDDEDISDTASFALDYFREAVSLVPLDFEDANTVNLIQSYGLLALLGVQSGNSAITHKYLGLYHGFAAQSNFHDESRWPADINTCEREVRRRLWWAMYRLEVHTACVLGSVIRCSETQCDVGYPSGFHHPAFIPGRDGQFENWFSGWNSTTDLYRVLEHIVNNFRSRQRKHRSIFHDYSYTTSDSTMERLATIQQDLLPEFSSVFSRSSDSGRNRCGFQACNILCTIHLARMITALSNGNDSLVTAFQTAQDMMENMNSVPQEYIRATGSPLLQQLAGVGHMLSGVTRKHVLSPEDYAVLRDVLVSIIEFLTRFSEYSKLAVTAHAKLSAQLKELDEHTNGMALDAAGNFGTEDQTSTWLSYSDHHIPQDEIDLDFHSADLLRAFTAAYNWKGP